MSDCAKQTFFLVDDDEDLGFLMCRCFQLSMPEADIIYFSDARQFMHRLETSERPTILITDLDMPVVDGFQLIEWIRARSSMTFPLVVFSGSVFSINRNRCSKLGADAFVTKGMGFSELLKSVQEVLKSHVLSNALNQG